MLTALCFQYQKSGKQPLCDGMVKKIWVKD